MRETSLTLQYLITFWVFKKSFGQGVTYALCNGTPVYCLARNYKPVNVYNVQTKPDIKQCMNACTIESGCATLRYTEEVCISGLFISTQYHQKILVTTTLSFNNCVFCLEITLNCYNVSFYNNRKYTRLHCKEYNLNLRFQKGK